jgi:hypothetical protein
MSHFMSDGEGYLFVTSEKPHSAVSHGNPIAIRYSGNVIVINQFDGI